MNLSNDNADNEDYRVSKEDGDKDEEEGRDDVPVGNWIELRTWQCLHIGDL